MLFLSAQLFARKHNFVAFGENTLEIAFKIRLSRETNKKKLFDVRRENTQHLNFSTCPGCDGLSSYLKKLYLSPQYSDLLITCENGKLFHAHKAILAARHPPFRKWLEENKNSFVLDTGYKEHTLLKLLTFLYTGLWIVSRDK
ncbi:hypothetical protein TNIN_298131 [Trichonephila inaurata madagascariensis]|uniref:BTB domain-containing protein n=1 Tax=Trichonephila inaurata madagascariensis TaxID=2747483 RepID=A0A8X6YY01_9ARAC|nr:hypothetical protein TNIN_298131 [Trichonephila inaurata madagascariensis]